MPARQTPASGRHSRTLTPAPAQQEITMTDIDTSSIDRTRRSLLRTALTALPAIALAGAALTVATTAKADDDDNGGGRRGRGGRRQRNDDDD
jgi:hypothetical protein